MAEANQQEPVKYGELAILGYNGHLPRGDRGRKRSKLVLMKKSVANGIQLSSNGASKMDANYYYKKSHNITYVLSKSTVEVAEYEEDKNVDMFQIGRSGANSIDFVVVDASSKQRDVSESHSTVSRFACRILINRDNPKEARIFAAGFDESRKVFFGEKSIKWRKSDGTMDGMTTNGVLLVHPRGPFEGEDTGYGYWREVSVGGDLYSLRENRYSKQVGKIIESESNILRDGTLINLCGATLLWRSTDSLMKTPKKSDIEELVEAINQKGLICSYPIDNLNQLLIPRKVSSAMEPRPHVFIKCGHVSYLKQSELEKRDDNKCPNCFTTSPTMKLCMGMEPAFFVDCGAPTYAFNPCGHMATERSVKYWAKAEIPHGISEFIAMCPFCAVPLDGWPGYTKLIF